MLSAPDLARLITLDLIQRNVEMSARLGLGHRKCSRLLGQKYAEPGADDHVITPGDFPAIERSVTTMEEASRLLADNADLLDAVRAFFADQNERRPAPVLQLVTGAGREGKPGRTAAPGLLARAAAAIMGREASVPPTPHCRALKREGSEGVR